MKLHAYGLAFAVLLGRCTTPATGLFVVSDTPPNVSSLLEHVELLVYPSATATTPTVQRNLEPNFPLSFSVLPNDLQGTYRIELRGVARGLAASTIFHVRRIVTMEEGQVRALSIPIRGICVLPTRVMCDSLAESCVSRPQCTSATATTIEYREGLDAACARGEIRGDNFVCESGPLVMP